MCKYMYVRTCTRKRMQLSELVFSSKERADMRTGMCAYVFLVSVSAFEPYFGSHS